MNNTRSILLAAFILVLSAGVVLGRLWAKLPMVESAPTTRPATQPSWLAEQLGLSPAQGQQVDAIWAETKLQLSKTGERRHTLDATREQAVVALLSSDQQKAYEQILTDFRARRAELDKERESLIHSADERSRSLLSDEQKRKWDQLRDSHGWHGPPHFNAASAPSFAPTATTRPAIVY